MHVLTVSSSKRQEIIDVTDKIKNIIAESGTKEGICLVYSPHSTCSVIINENYDPNIMLDINDALNDIIPQGKWRHDKVDGNADAHIKASIIGASQNIIIKDGKLQLGKWQNICFADFDGPRERKIYIKILGDTNGKL